MPKFKSILYVNKQGSIDGLQPAGFMQIIKNNLEVQDNLYDYVFALDDNGTLFVVRAKNPIKEVKDLTYLTR